MPRAAGESLCAFRGSFEMNDSNKFTLLYWLLHVHVVHVDDYNLRITNKMCDVPNDFHVHLSPLCSWLWPGAGCSRLPGLRLRHCLTGEVCCARRCHDVCCFLQILISWVSWVSFEVSCCFFIVSWRFLFAKKLQSFGFPCWACQYLGPLHLRAFLSIPADSALPATLFLKDASSQLATGTEQSSKV